MNKYYTINFKVLNYINFFNVKLSNCIVIKRD